jgi:transcriptional regulator with XRE-family HTH domain
MPILKRTFLNSPPEVISKRIKEAREARGVTASGLARLVGVTPTAVWNWEKNSITPRHPVLEQIARALDVSTSFLLTGREELRQVEQEKLPQKEESVASILQNAKARLAQVTGLTLECIKLNVQFVTD